MKRKKLLIKWTGVKTHSVTIPFDDLHGAKLDHDTDDETDIAAVTMVTGTRPSTIKKVVFEGDGENIEIAIDRGGSPYEMNVTRATALQIRTMLLRNGLDEKSSGRFRRSRRQRLPPCGAVSVARRSRD